MSEGDEWPVHLGSDYIWNTWEGDRATGREARNTPASIILHAVRHLADVDFDTCVGTGVSGAIGALLIGEALGKTWLIIRKETENTTHSRQIAEGELRRRWIFVDDFVGSGDTRRSVHRALVRLSRGHRYRPQGPEPLHGIFPELVGLEYVGTYTYGVGGKWVPAAEEEYPAAEEGKKNGGKKNGG